MILCLDLDLAAVVVARYDLVVMGHYARPDVFTLLVNGEPMRGIDYSGPLAFSEEEQPE